MKRMKLRDVPCPKPLIRSDGDPEVGMKAKGKEQYVQATIFTNDQSTSTRKKGDIKSVVESEIEEEKKEKNSRIGEILASLTFSDFASAPNDKPVSESGVEIMKQLSRVIYTIKEKLGSDAKGTIFGAPIQAIAAFSGFHRETASRFSQTSEYMKNDVAPTQKVTLASMSKKELAMTLAYRIPLFDRFKIRQHLHELWKNKKHVTAEILHRWAREHIGYQNSLTYFRYVMAGLGLRFKKVRRISAIEDRPDVGKRRWRYLVEKALANNDNPWFIGYDETWIHPGMGSDFEWQYENGTEYQKARMCDNEHPVPGPSKPKDKGDRCIVLGMVSEDGLLKESIECIISGKSAGQQLEDYHSEMNGETYRKYMERMVPIIAQKAAAKGRNAYVLEDNAPYHSMTRDKPPTTATRRPQLIEWLQNHQVPFDEKWNMKELRVVANTFIAQNGGKAEFRVYEMDEWADEVWGVRFIRLPPYHCHWNPIEFLWANLKSHLRRLGDSEDKLDIVRKRALEFFDSYKDEDAANLFDHCRRDEDDVRSMLMEKMQMEEVDYNPDENDEEFFEELESLEDETEMRDEEAFDH